MLRKTCYLFKVPELDENAVAQFLSAQVGPRDGMFVKKVSKDYAMKRIEIYPPVN